MGTTEGLIEKQKSGFKLNFGNCSAIFLGLTLSCAFYGLAHYIHEEAISHPAVLMGMPFVAIMWLVLVIPLCMYTSYQADFRNLNPLHPLHYLIIARKCFKALKDNDFKVAEKDM